MHRWFCRRDPKLLEPKLRGFENGGQFLIKTKIHPEELERLIHTGNEELEMRPQPEEVEGQVFRGEILRLEIPNIDERVVVIHFTWLCERRVSFDRNWSPKPKWVLIPPTSMQCSDTHQIIFSQSMRLRYDSFYFPKEGEQWERLKLWIRGEDYGRLYKLGDPENLVRNGDEFSVLGV